jgi:ATP-binding cassette subfamily B protein
MTNTVYLAHNYRTIVLLGLLAIVIFTVKGLATYSSTVVLSRIGNRIVADNQRRAFDKLLQENVGFFADRHSSEFITRISAGAAAVSGVINLLITAMGRDLMSLVGLIIVMVVQDPIMSVIGLLIAPPAFLILRKLIRRVRAITQTQFIGSMQIIETLQESVQGIRMVKAFALEEEMRRRFAVSVEAVEREQNGASREPRESYDGNARRFRGRPSDPLWRLSRNRNRSDAGGVCFI